MASKIKNQFRNIVLYFISTVIGLIFTFSVIKVIEDRGYDPMTLVILSGVGIVFLAIFEYYKLK